MIHFRIMIKISNEPSLVDSTGLSENSINSSQPLSLAGSQVHAIQAEAVGRAVVRRKKYDSAVTSPKCGRKTGSNRSEIGAVPIWLPAMKGRRDKNLFRKWKWS
jgi:hypothetical protein